MGLFLIVFCHYYHMTRQARDAYFYFTFLTALFQPGDLQPAQQRGGSSVRSLLSQI